MRAHRSLSGYPYYWTSRQDQLPVNDRVPPFRTFLARDDTGALGFGAGAAIREGVDLTLTHQGRSATQELRPIDSDSKPFMVTVHQGAICYWTKRTIPNRAGTYYALRRRTLTADDVIDLSAHISTDDVTRYGEFAKDDQNLYYLGWTFTASAGGDEMNAPVKFNFSPLKVDGGGMVTPMTAVEVAGFEVSEDNPGYMNDGSDFWSGDFPNTVLVRIRQRVSYNKDGKRVRISNFTTKVANGAGQTAVDNQTVANLPHEYYPNDAGGYVGATWGPGDTTNEDVLGGLHGFQFEVPNDDFVLAVQISAGGMVTSRRWKPIGVHYQPWHMQGLEDGSVLIWAYAGETRQVEDRTISYAWTEVLHLRDDGLYRLWTGKEATRWNRSGNPLTWTTTTKSKMLERSDTNRLCFTWTETLKYVDAARGNALFEHAVIFEPAGGELLFTKEQIDYRPPTS